MLAANSARLAGSRRFSQVAALASGEALSSGGAGAGGVEAVGVSEAPAPGVAVDEDAPESVDAVALGFTGLSSASAAQPARVSATLTATIIEAIRGVCMYEYY
ncbi:hypothetical protein GCM10022381_29410 [Leifsonia kafniensis]|uniref:Uncharacterized protein n=1 Tax=Leifsonia kafniensis TaxID=475957 RepID=A0ABP7KQM5_9MICO